MNEAPELSRLDDLDAAWNERAHGRRHRLVLEGAASLRQRLCAMGTIESVRSLPITTLPYPTRYAFQGAAVSPAPFVTMTHRALLVQFRQGDRTRSMLFNPTDVARSRKTPFFAKLESAVGATMSRLMSTQFETLESQLSALGVSTTDDIDYVAFDHFHTQDLRGLLGTADGLVKPRFANARLLAPKREWDAWIDLHPMQKAWYVADGREGVCEDNVVLTDGDLALGDGVMLVRTPGHTEGNQTLFLKTSRGVWGCSENGTCVDNWSPTQSRIAGIAATARHQELEVILNANTPEGGAEQYSSMCLEKALVDAIPASGGFVQMFSSSEVTPALLSPGLGPSYLLQKLEDGSVIGRKPQKNQENPGFGAPPLTR